MARQIQRWSAMKNDNDAVCITMDDSGPLVLWKDVAPMLAEAPPSAAPNSAMPQLPSYLDLIASIDDSRLTTMDGKERVAVGTRIMYDRIVVALGIKRQ